jgi:hypothetical protein
MSRFPIIACIVTSGIILAFLTDREPPDGWEELR